MNPEKKEKSIDVYILPTKSSIEEKTSNPKTFWHVDKEMLRFKVHFFLFVGGIAAGVPYIVVFAKNRIGISASSLGVVLTAQMFLFIFTKPMIGYLADYFNKLKEIISVLTTIYMACFFTLLAIPSIELEQVQNSRESFKTLDISRQCAKYNDIVVKTISQSRTNFSLVESSSSNFSNFHLSAENVTCYQFSDNSFESLLVHHLKLHEDFNDNDINKTNKENSTTRNVTKVLKIFVILLKSDPINEKMCLIDSIPQFNELSSNITLKSIESCEISSQYIFKGLTRTSTDVELHCATCGFGNMSVDITSSIPENSLRKKDYQTYQFWMFALLDTISGICVSAIFTLSDTACCESIQKHGADFGQQRLWGAIGWGSIAPLAGFINDYTNDFLAAYILMGGMMALFLWNISKIDLVKPHYSKNILKDVGTVLQSKDFLIFEVVIFANGIGTGIIWYYLIWFLNSIGGSALLCGLTLTVQSFVGVIPAMFFSGWIIKKFGHFNMLIVSLAAYAIRFLWYSYLQNPWIILPVEFLHGITYGLYYTVLASYAKLSAKPGTEATTQAIIFSTHEGLGSGIGCVLSGMGFDYFGGRQTFFYTSMFCLCGVFISIILSAHLQSRKGIMKLTAAEKSQHTFTFY